MNPSSAPKPPSSVIRTLPFGSWPSPINAAQIAGGALRLGQTAARAGAICWIEGRPAEEGRNVLVRRAPDGTTVDLTRAPTDVRTRAHEYGGGAFVLLKAGAVAYSDDADRQLHVLDGAGTPPRRLTDGTGVRYADLQHDAARNRLVAVREDHRAGAADAVATLVAIDLADGAVRVLAEGHDFYASPCLSPDGSGLAWLSWDHPDMPWDATTLWRADLDADGSPSNVRTVAGGAGVSIFQPAWSPAGELHFVSDRSGWWNLWRKGRDGVESLRPMEAEFGVAQWQFGMSTYGFDARGRIVCAWSREARSSLSILDPATGSFETLEMPFCALRDVHVDGDTVACIAASPTAAEAVMRLELRTREWQVVRSSGSELSDPAVIAVAEPITFPTTDGAVAHGFFYRPTNPAVHGPAGERPPLLVASHGGPTGSTDAGFRWAWQYWTSRGFAVVDVNYRGSSGHGRAYRDALKGRWGIADVDDCVAAAEYLVARGEADPARLAIRGSSAGGYTTLAALAFRDVFKAGASHYGIGDLETLARDTHKFESRYLDRLIGPYPESAAVYRERSPIHHVDRLASALILLQGADDKVVPPAQAEAMYAAVRAKGLPVALLLFEHEQHGFRRAANIRRALEAELAFYGEVFGFTPADTIEPLEIANRPKR